MVGGVLTIQASLASFYTGFCPLRSLIAFVTKQCLVNHQIYRSGTANPFWTWGTRTIFFGIHFQRWSAILKMASSHKRTTHGPVGRPMLTRSLVRLSRRDRPNTPTDSWYTSMLSTALSIHLRALGLRQQAIYQNVFTRLFLIPLPSLNILIWCDTLSCDQSFHDTHVHHQVFALFRHLELLTYQGAARDSS